MRPRMERRREKPAAWRGRLRREVAVLLALKLAALALLWVLFFSPAERLVVDGAGTSRRFGLTSVEKLPQSAVSANAPAPGAAAARSGVGTPGSERALRPLPERTP